MIEHRSDSNIAGTGFNGEGESELPTQRTINKEKKHYCNKIADAINETSMWKEGYKGYAEMLERKKCLFLLTEENFRRYRNTDITIGTELLQSNEILKNCIGNVVKGGVDLSAKLKIILKGLKEVKTKMSNLREAACKLENCITDSCNCDQMIALTGNVPDDQCNNTNRSKNPNNRPKECDGISEILDQLLCMPKYLSYDIDSILKSTSEAIGIQVFSNIHTLEPLQNSFSDQTRSFEKLLADIMKSREGDLKKMQEDLVKTIQNATHAEIQTYKKRSDFMALEETINFICNPSCECIKKDKDCDKRLDDCEKIICEICTDVQRTFCPRDEGNNKGYSHS